MGILDTLFPGTGTKDILDKVFSTTIEEDQSAAPGYLERLARESQISSESKNLPILNAPVLPPEPIVSSDEIPTVELGGPGRGVFGMPRTKQDIAQRTATAANLLAELINPETGGLDKVEARKAMDRAFGERAWTDEDAAKAMAAVDRRGVLGKIGGALESGAENIAAGLLDAPRIVLDPAQNLQAKLMNKVLGVPDVQTGPSVIDAGADLSGLIQDRSEKVSATAGFDDTIAGYLGKGEFSKAGSKLGYSVIENTPQLAGTIAATAMGNLGAGLSILGLSAGGNKLRDLEKTNPGMPVEERAAIAAANGIIEAATERLGTFRYWKAILESQGRAAAVDTAKGALKEILKPMASEGAEEVVARVSENFIDRQAGVKRADGKPVGIMDGVSDSAIVGFAIGAPAGVTSVVNLKTARGAELNQAVDDLARTIKNGPRVAEPGKAFDDLLGVQRSNVEPRPPATPADVRPGYPTEVVSKNGAKVEAQYALVPREVIQASHDPAGTPNPNYPLVNPTDYADVEQQKKVVGMATDFKTIQHITESTSAAEGPIVVARVTNPDGQQNIVVVAGNARKMATDNMGPEKQADMAEYVNANAANFGLSGVQDPSQQLVRFIGDFDLRNPGELDKLQGIVDRLSPTGYTEVSKRAESGEFKKNPVAMRSKLSAYWRSEGVEPEKIKEFLAVVDKTPGLAKSFSESAQAPDGDRSVFTPERMEKRAAEIAKKEKAIAFNKELIQKRREMTASWSKAEVPLDKQIDSLNQYMDVLKKNPDTDKATLKEANRELTNLMRQKTALEKQKLEEGRAELAKKIEAIPTPPPAPTKAIEAPTKKDAEPNEASSDIVSTLKMADNYRNRELKIAVDKWYEYKSAAGEVFTGKLLGTFSHPGDLKAKEIMAAVSRKVTGGRRVELVPANTLKEVFEPIDIEDAPEQAKKYFKGDIEIAGKTPARYYSTLYATYQARTYAGPEPVQYYRLVNLKTAFPEQLANSLLPDRPGLDFSDMDIPEPSKQKEATHGTAQKAGSEGVLQRAPEGTGRGGSERSGVERKEQGNAPARSPETKVPEASKPKGMTQERFDSLWKKSNEYKEAYHYYEKGKETLAKNVVARFEKDMADRVEAFDRLDEAATRLEDTKPAHPYSKDAYEIARSARKLIHDIFEEPNWRQAVAEVESEIREFDDLSHPRGKTATKSGKRHQDLVEEVQNAGPAIDDFLKQAEAATTERKGGGTRSGKVPKLDKQGNIIGWTVLGRPAELEGFDQAKTEQLAAGLKNLRSGKKLTPHQYTAIDDALTRIVNIGMAPDVEAGAPDVQLTQLSQLLGGAQELAKNIQGKIAPELLEKVQAMGPAVVSIKPIMDISPVVEEILSEKLGEATPPLSPEAVFLKAVLDGYKNPITIEAFATHLGTVLRQKISVNPAEDGVELGRSDGSMLQAMQSAKVLTDEMLKDRPALENPDYKAEHEYPPSWDLADINDLEDIVMESTWSPLEATDTGYIESTLSGEGIHSAQPDGRPLVGWASIKPRLQELLVNEAQTVASIVGIGDDVELLAALTKAFGNPAMAERLVPVFPDIWNAVRKSAPQPKKEKPSNEPSTSQSTGGQPGAQPEAGGNVSGRDISDRPISDDDVGRIIAGRDVEAFRSEDGLRVFLKGAQQAKIPARKVEQSVRDATRTVRTWLHATKRVTYPELANAPDGYPRNPGAMILAHATGTGKTYVAALVLKEIRDRLAEKHGAGPKPRILWLTNNSGLIDQIKDDTKAFNLQDITFSSYKRMRDSYRPKAHLFDPESVYGGQWDLIFADEAHAMKNVNEDVTTADAGENLLRHADMAIYSSATPFENPGELEYLANSRIFDNYPGRYPSWARAHGVNNIGVWNPPAHKKTQYAIDAKKWLETAGVMLAQDAELPEGFVTARLGKVDLADNQIDTMNAIDDAFREVTARASEQGDGLTVSMLNAQHLLMSRRALESMKLTESIKLLQQEVAEAKAKGENRKWLIMTATKSERDIEENNRMMDLEQSILEQAKLMEPGQPAKRTDDFTAVLKRLKKSSRSTARALENIWGGKGTAEDAGIVTDRLNSTFQKYYKEVHEILAASGVDVNFRSPIEEFLKAGEDLGLKPVRFTGDTSAVERRKVLSQFRTGASKMMVSTLDASGTGLSVHDLIGNMPITQYVLTMPWTGTKLVQAAGRAARYGMLSKVLQHYFFAKHGVEQRLAAVVGQRLKDMKATVYGVDELPHADDMVDWNMGELGERRDEGSTETGIPLAAAPGPVSGSTPVTGPASFFQGLRPAWMNQEPVDKDQAKIRKKIQSDKKGRIGTRTILDDLIKYFDVQLRVGREQVTKKNPAHVLTRGVIRGMSGTIIGHKPTLVMRTSIPVEARTNIHEIGHALVSQDFETVGAQLLEAAGQTNPRWPIALVDAIMPLADRRVYPDSQASADSSHEAMAEWVSRYVTRPFSFRDASGAEVGMNAPVVKIVESYLEQFHPDWLNKLRGATLSYEAHVQRPISVQRTANRKDIRIAGQNRPVGETVDSILQHLFRTSSPIDRHISIVFRAIRKGAQEEGMTEGQALNLAREARRSNEDTPADMNAAYHMQTEIPQRVQNALYGDGLYVSSYSSPKASTSWHPTNPELEAFLEKDLGDLYPKNQPFGYTIKLSDSFKDAVMELVPESEYDAFETWGDDKASLSRYKIRNGRKEYLNYPGSSDYPPEVLQKEVDRLAAEHPNWVKAFDNVEKIYDSVAVSLMLSGQKSPEEFYRIKGYDLIQDPKTGAYSKRPRVAEDGTVGFKDYWFLLRTAERGASAESAKVDKTNPQVNLRRARGSGMPYADLEVALRKRITEAVQAWADRALLESLLHYSRRIATDNKLPASARRIGSRMIMELHPDLRSVASIGPHDEQEIRRRIAKWIELKDPNSSLDADDINLQFIGMPLYRKVKPDAINVITYKTVDQNGKDRLRFFQIEDRNLFNIFAADPEVDPFTKFVSELIAPMTAVSKKLFTQNWFYITGNIPRDIGTAGWTITGEPSMEGAAPWIPMVPMAQGLYHVITGSDFTKHGFSPELWSQAREFSGVRSQMRDNSFMQMLKEDSVRPEGWNKMSIGQKVRASVGMAYASALKVLSIFNWLSGSRYVSAKTEESPRTFAAEYAASRGFSPLKSRQMMAKITGEFGYRPLSAKMRAWDRIAGFTNARKQIAYQFFRKATDPDPEIRRQLWARWAATSFALRVGLAALTILAELNAAEDEEDKKKRIKNIIDRPTRDRFTQQRVFGGIKLQYEQGAMGVLEAMGVYALEQEILTRMLSDRGTDWAKELAQQTIDNLSNPDGGALRGLIGAGLEYTGFQNKAIMEAAMNYSYFRDREIVPDYLTNKDDPEQAVFESTPSIYPMLSAMSGNRIHPLKIQYVAQNALNRAVDDAARTFDYAMGKESSELADIPAVGRLFVRNATGFNSQPVIDAKLIELKYLNAKQTFDRLDNTLGVASDDPRKAKAAEVMAKLSLAHEYYTQVKDLGEEIKKNTKLINQSSDPVYRGTLMQQNLSYKANMTDLAAAAVGIARNMK